MIKTFTIDDEKWRVVPLMPDEKMIEAGDSIRHGRIKTSIIYMHMLAAAPQPEPVDATVEQNSQQWRGMSGAVAWQIIERHADNWTDIGLMMDEWLAANKQPEPVESEPVAFTNKAQLGYVTDGMHPDIPLAMWSKNTPYADANIPLYTTPQPDRVAELEAALKVARDALEFYSDPHVAGQPATARKAVAKINEVLKP